MPTCPNCGSIVMDGDSYCSHCGAHFKWSYVDEMEDTPDYGTASEFACDEPAHHNSYTSETDYNRYGQFLDFGEVSETYLEAGDIF